MRQGLDAAPYINQAHHEVRNLHDLSRDPGKLGKRNILLWAPKLSRFGPIGGFCVPL